MAYVRSRGQDIWVSRRGSGPPLLLVNGLGANLAMWEPFAARLKGHEIISFDLPGTGRSKPARWPMRMPAVARLVAGLLDALEVERADVLGYSLGGLVAQELAHRAPERVGRLVLGATVPGVPSVPPPPLVGWLMMSPARYYDRRVAEWTVPIIAGGRTARDRDALHTGLDRRMTHPPSPIGYAQQLYSIAGWSSHLWLRTVRHPTLVVHGDDDRLVPLLNARYLAWALPDARLHVLPGAGHLLFFDEAAAAARTVRDFLTR
jgi:pimeloyl-ACP methyl ester carboxylesterase